VSNSTAPPRCDKVRALSKLIGFHEFDIEIRTSLRLALCEEGRAGGGHPRERPNAKAQHVKLLFLERRSACLQ